ncbi:hypothetical protein [uncultured Dysosmobacter sp.]|uniref:hypothetical protein n=1 Tax=uncultured Dysosmobacter sp. TaxID=2591384 RepID=UPI002607539F|nr:hypothetical protein [uncultured Dysosmobacter sp.]
MDYIIGHMTCQRHLIPDCLHTGLLPEVYLPEILFAAETLGLPLTTDKEAARD